MDCLSRTPFLFPFTGAKFFFLLHCHLYRGVRKDYVKYGNTSQLVYSNYHSWLTRSCLRNNFFFLFNFMKNKIIKTSGLRVYRLLE